MCGIFSYYSEERLIDIPFLESCVDKLVHRGPDDSGVWHDQGAGIFLGHRRLSILDLSATGRQPMLSGDGRWVIAFNGEIYNWRHLRLELEASCKSFRGHSDTEVLLEGIASWGIEQTLQKCVGMFAFALWDRRDRRLFVARDRLGEKPLYYSWNRYAWLVASELKALKAVPETAWTVDNDSVALYLRNGYLPAPATIYREARKLKPGHLAELCRNGDILEHCYWNFSEIVYRGLANPFQGTLEEAVQSLSGLLDDAISMQRAADVPVGAFLSGGIDSSAVVAFMQRQGGAHVKTFSIGYEEQNYDESAYAAAVARHLGTDHVEMRVSPDDAMRIIPDLPVVYDEPFGDSSAIPTLLVSRLAGRYVKVALTGDGGDEVFGGYGRYHALKQEWNKLDNIASFLRRPAALTFEALSSLLDNLGKGLQAEKYAMREEAYGIGNMQELYRYRMSQWWNVTELMAQPVKSVDESFFPHMNTPYHHGMAVDTVTYLPENNLVKVDRAAMSCGLETRIPMLDHRIVEWSWTLPEDYKIDDSGTKRVLRELLYRHVPKHLLERPKMGFAVPVGEWIKGPLQEWAESLLSPSKLAAGGVLNPARITRVWHLHREGKIDASYRLWTVLALQAWLEGR